MAISSKYQATRMLSAKLFEIGQELHSTIVDEDGNSRAINKLEALSRSIWTFALGREETLRDGSKKKHLPAMWAISVLLDRIEGKVMPVMTDKEPVGTPKIADRISELGKQKLNELIDD